jgi:acetone carboxylase gamma subunit
VGKKWILKVTFLVILLFIYKNKILMRIENDGKTLVADEGKVIRCKCHHVIMGTEVYLKEKMKDGVLVEDTIDNYEEIDAPELPEEIRDLKNEAE